VEHEHQVHHADPPVRLGEPAVGEPLPQRQAARASPSRPSTSCPSPTTSGRGRRPAR
jgi:hypothetical protein